ncbi:hypothetical protein HRR99_07000 [Agrobacterium vaccinii]|uniref:hypothetical protein n=1 Tax=Agrobacterium vaccinii TaxID=2735528 RepID=UPI001E64A8BA|nr:hypothetical protein [Agrobacterium vaccinii]UHS61277.1 hypothetical protein HRR99_07000 [Agrobacterium vaccinii]
MRSEITPPEIQDTSNPHPQFFAPKATIKCEGAPAFRNKEARDLACLLDVDPDVKAWRCLPLELCHHDLIHAPDFLVTYCSGAQRLLDAVDMHPIPWIQAASEEEGFEYGVMTRADREEGARLRNARDLLRYGNYQCPLGDRIRVIATIDEVGSFTVAEGLSLFREIAPVPGMATLILQQFISVDLDEALIGPDTVVRRGNR